MAIVNRWPLFGVLLGLALALIAAASAQAASATKPKPLSWATEGKAEALVSKTQTATFRWTLLVDNTSRPMTETIKPGSESPFVECAGVSASHPNGLPLYRRFVCNAYVTQPFVIRNGFVSSWTCITSDEDWFVTTTSVPGKVIIRPFTNQVRLTERQKLRLYHDVGTGQGCGS
jgi:hypothetical protein